jgi:hypothetical protein
MLGLPRINNGNFTIARADFKTELPEECKKLSFGRYHKYFENGQICTKYEGVYQYTIPKNL